ncbi:MAG: GAF domain-containing protein, partial [Acidobacteriia bacterium]|nr:GAF domain-containing protein [Terriglobia bacterium]
AVFVPERDLRTVPQALQYLGRLVRTEGEVADTGVTSAGPYILIGPENDGYKLFVPRHANEPFPDLGVFRKKDRATAIGLAIQYTIRPPYNHWFELLVSDSAELARSAPLWTAARGGAAAALGAVLVVALLLWSRERRLRSQRERLRHVYQRGEEVLGASSAEAILKRISEVLPGILGVTRVQLYSYNRGSKSLDAASADGGEPVSISLASSPGDAKAGAVACFHYRTLLVIPDVARSPFPMSGRGGEPAPKSLLCVPMFAQNEIVGVLELDQHDRMRDFTADEQALAQHLGNQIGVALRLLDQKSVQEQLSRTEKVAAVGRLISGIVNELATPLASISDLAGRASQSGRHGPAERELAVIAIEARKASNMVARLVSFAGEQVEAHSVCLTTLLRSLIEFREGDRKASGIRLQDLTSGEPLFVLGSQGQLEQVFLNLLVHAEQSLAEAPQKTITVRTGVLGKRLLVEIAFTSPSGSRKPEETAAVLGVTRSVIAGHGGEVRLIEKNNETPRFEVDLPAAVRERAASPSGAPSAELARSLTVLVIEPDEAAQRLILGLLAARGCRVVPIGNSDTALELAQRMRFDAAFCSVHAPGLNWVELSERMHQRVGGFVLISDRYDAELAADFAGEGRFVLPKPVQDTDLDRILHAVERRAAVRA